MPKVTEAIDPGFSKKHPKQCPQAGLFPSDSAIAEE
jgi:hypothetical protein